MAYVCLLNGSIAGLFNGPIGTKESLEQNNPGFICYETDYADSVVGKLFNPETGEFTDDPNYVQPVQPEPEAPPVPQEISALSGLAAIDEVGLADAYTAWATSPSRTFLERAFIEKATTWKRDNAALNSAASEIGLSEVQMDTMFIRAKELEAIL